MFMKCRRTISGLLVCAMLLGILAPVSGLIGQVFAAEAPQVGLTSLSLDGGYDLSYVAGSSKYEIRIPAGHPRVPQISAAADSTVQVAVTQAALPESETKGTGTVVVTDSTGNASTYTVTFLKDAALGFHLQYDDYYTFVPETTGTVAQLVSSDPSVIEVTADGKLHALKVSDTAVSVEAKDAGGNTLDTLVINKVVKAPLNVFLITGQSNAYGTYDIPSGTSEAEFTAAQIEKTLKPAPGTVLCTDVTKTGTIERDMYDLSVGRRGFSSALGKTWYEMTGEKTLMIQTAVNGAPIEAWMKPEGTTRYTYGDAKANFYETTKSAYEHCLELINAPDSNYELGRIHAYWLQGETGMGNTFNPDKNGAGIGGWDLGSKEHILSAQEYYDIFMKNMEYFTGEFNVEFMGVLLARATQGVVSPESLELQLLTDLVPTRAAQYALHNTHGTQITLVSRVCDIARMESYPDNTVEGWGYIGTGNLHYNQIGHNANGVAAATNTYLTLFSDSKKATELEVIKENGRDRFTEGEVLNIGPGNTYQTAAMVLPMYTDTPQVTYEVADKTVCTIDKFGLIIAAADAAGKETTVTYKCEAANLTKTIKVKIQTVSAEGTLNSAISWKLENGVLTLTGTGETPSYALGVGSPFKQYAEDVTKVVVGEGITRLNNHLFYQMTAISDVQLPSTLTHINARAFNGCTSLKALTIPASVYSLGLSAFTGSGIQDIYYPRAEAPTSISATAPFGDCTFNLHLPCDHTWEQATFTAVGGTSTVVLAHDFVDGVCSKTGCGEIEKVAVTGSFSTGVTWHYLDGVLTISGTGATDGYEKKHIGTEAWPFTDFSELVTKIVVEDGVTDLGTHLFYGMSNVESVTLAASVAKFNTRVFNGCAKLKELTIPGNVTLLGYEALVGTGITDLYFGGDAPATISSTKPCTGLTYNVHVICNNETWTSAKLTAMGGTPTLVKVHDYQNNTCTLCGDVKTIPVTGVVLDKTEASVEVDKTVNLTVTVSPENATDKTVTWSSSDETVATVDANGVVTAIKAGTAVITVKSVADPTLSAQCTVTVTAPPATSGTCGDNISWSLVNGVLTLAGTGETTNFSRDSATDVAATPWWDLRDSITSVVVGEGITKLGNYALYKCANITSIQLPSTLTALGARVMAGCTSLTAITLPASLGVLGLGAMENSGLTEVYYERGENPTTISTKPLNGCTYDLHLPCNHTWSDTNITKLGGTSNVIKVHDYQNNTCTLCGDVKTIPVTGVVLDKTEASAEVDKTVNLTVTVSPENATDKTVTWSSSDETVATVDANGVVTAIKAGTAVITVKSVADPTLSAQCTVTVTAPPATSGTCGDNISWSLVNGVLTLAGTGETSNFSRDSATDVAATPWWDLRDSITSVVVGEGITRLGNLLFYRCTNLTSVTLPASLERIETRIFKGCTSLTKLTVSSNLVYLGYEAMNSSGITDLYFTGDAPDGFSTTAPFGSGHAYNLHVPCNNDTWTATVLTKLGGTVTKVLEHKWEGTTCTACGASTAIPVTGITLDKTQASASIGQKVNLTVTLTPDNAADKSVTWSSSDETVATVDANGVVTAIKAGTAVITVKSVADPSLSAQCTVTVQSTATGKFASGVTWKFENGVLTITGSGATDDYELKQIGTAEYPFSGFSDKVTSVVVGDGVTKLGKHLFYNMSNLTSVTLPASVNSLETRAFKNCTSLTKLTIPGTLNLLGYEALVGTGITELHFGGSKPKTISGTKPCTGLTYKVYVPCNKCSDADWSTAVLNLMGGNCTLEPAHNWSGNKCTLCGAKTGNPVTQIKLDVSKLELFVNASYGIQATVLPANATDAGVLWTSSNEAVVTVSASGKVTGISVGTATITATARDGSGIKATCTVTVKKGLGGDCGNNAMWTFENGVLTITGKGEMTTFTRNAENDLVNYPWADIKDQIKKVVIGEGITAVRNYAFYKCPNVEAVELPSTLTIISYGAFQGTALKSVTIPAGVFEFGSQVFKDSGLKEITFLGLTPISFGKNLFENVTANLHYICGDQEKNWGDGLTWIVSHDYKTVDGITKCSRCGAVDGTLVTEITLDKTQLQLIVGESFKLNAVITPGNATYPKLEWVSSETEVITVTADGVVTAVSAGGATITVKATDGSGIQAVCQVSVRNSNTEETKPNETLPGVTQPGATKPEATKPGTSQPADPSQPSETSGAILWWILGIGGAAVLAAVVILLVSKKKKS